MVVLFTDKLHLFPPTLFATVALFKLLRSRNMLMDIHSRRTTSTRHVMAPPFYLLKIMLSKSVVFDEDRSEKLTRLYCELYEF